MNTPTSNPGLTPAPAGSRRPGVWRVLWRRASVRVCVALVAGYAGVALYGEWAYATARAADRTPDYQRPAPERRYQPPGWVRVWRGETPRTWRARVASPLGTDGLGRDVARRLAQGTRIAFRVGLLTSAIALPLGLLLGLLGGYCGGWVDDAVVWLYATFAAIPGLLFVLAIALVAGRGLTGVCLGIGLTSWVGLCRVVRAETLSLRGRPFILAARALGYSHTRIVLRHLLPNVAHLAIIHFSLRFPAAVGAEVILSFLGIGVQGEPSWGIMLNNGRLRLWQGAWWELTFTTLAVFGLVLAFNLLGDALRDALDPRLRREE